MIRVGTSGWSYDDWHGPVYPPALAQGERLPRYAERLRTVEVDATYYRDPAPGVVRGWAERTKGEPTFELSVKAPGALTHDALVRGEPEEAARIAKEWSALVAAPLAELGRLGVVLLQVAPGVVAGPDALARLAAALDALAPHKAAVELRHASWLAGDGVRRDLVATLDARDAALVVVDGPSFPVVEAGAASHAYVRFHGRNVQAWSRPSPDSAPMERYRYRYADEELTPWAARLAQIGKRKQVVRAFFNNHPEGNAFHDALRFEGLLAAHDAGVVRARSPQRTLF